MGVSGEETWMAKEIEMEERNYSLGIILCLLHAINSYPWWLRRQKICLQYRRLGFNPWVAKILWRMEWLPTAVF